MIATLVSSGFFSQLFCHWVPTCPTVDHGKHLVLSTVWSSCDAFFVQFTKQWISTQIIYRNLGGKEARNTFAQFLIVWDFRRCLCAFCLDLFWFCKIIQFRSEIVRRMAQTETYTKGSSERSGMNFGVQRVPRDFCAAIEKILIWSNLWKIYLFETRIVHLSHLVYQRVTLILWPTVGSQFWSRKAPHQLKVGLQPHLVIHHTSNSSARLDFLNHIKVIKSQNVSG